MLWTRGVAMVTMKLLLAVLLLVVVTPSLVAAAPAEDPSDNSVGALKEVQEQGLDQELMADKEVQIEALVGAASGDDERALRATPRTTRGRRPTQGRYTTRKWNPGQRTTQRPRWNTTRGRRSAATSVVPSVLTTASAALFYYALSAMRW